MEQSAPPLCSGRKQEEQRRFSSASLLLRSHGAGDLDRAEQWIWPGGEELSSDMDWNEGGLWWRRGRRRRRRRKSIGGWRDFVGRIEKVKVDVLLWDLHLPSRTENNLRVCPAENQT